MKTISQTYDDSLHTWWHKWHTFLHSGCDAGLQHCPSQADYVRGHEECETCFQLLYHVMYVKFWFVSSRQICPCSNSFFGENHLGDLRSKYEYVFVFSAVIIESVQHGIDCTTSLWSFLVFPQVWCGDRNQLLPDNKERFDRIICVLGRERISAGRHYWEVRGSLLWVLLTLLIRQKAFIFATELCRKFTRLCCEVITRRLLLSDRCMARLFSWDHILHLAQNRPGCQTYTAFFPRTGGGGWEDRLGFGCGQTVNQQEGEDWCCPEQRILVPQPERQVGGQLKCISRITCDLWMEYNWNFKRLIFFLLHVACLKKLENWFLTGKIQKATEKLCFMTVA